MMLLIDKTNLKASNEPKPLFLLLIRVQFILWFYDGLFEFNADNSLWAIGELTS